MATAVAKFKLRASGLNIGIVIVVSGFASSNTFGKPAVSRPNTR